MKQPNQYNINQIIKSQYTGGFELALEGNKNYSGLYHIMPDGTAWVGEAPTQNPIQLFKYVINENDAVTKFKMKASNDIVTVNYHNPIPYTLQISDIDYQYPFVERYFIQHITQPTVIFEISIDQYRSINTRNQIGIDGALWIGVFIKWYLQKEMALHKNNVEVKAACKKIKYLDKYLTNYLEFTR